MELLLFCDNDSIAQMSCIDSESLGSFWGELFAAVAEIITITDCNRIQTENWDCPLKCQNVHCERNINRE